jgi:hypothetical protein
MLIYHPAYDAFHCVFRMLAIIEAVPDVEVDKARLLDFYLLFPALIANIRLPTELASTRKVAKLASNIYHDPLSPKNAFRDLRHIQNAAIKCVAASGLIEPERFKSGFLARTEMQIPLIIKEKIGAFIDSRQPLSEVVLLELSKMRLTGDNGLKHRTSLMEYRYDAS